MTTIYLVQTLSIYNDGVATTKAFFSKEAAIAYAESLKTRKEEFEAKYNEDPDTYHEEYEDVMDVHGVYVHPLEVE
jgi:hypothetical protein